MKRNILLFLLPLILNVNLFAQNLKLLSIDDITKKVKTDNFTILQNAEKVYQGKENIKYARASLLPKLNLWNVLKLGTIIIDPLSLGDLIQDVAPFLIPTNWFKWRQDKYLFQAKKEQYRALWANEITTVRLLFMSVFRDKALASLVANKTKKYKEIYEIAKARNLFGHGNIFALNIIRDRYLSLVEDSRNLDNMIYSETKELQLLSGIDNQKLIKLLAPPLPHLLGARKIDATKFILKAIDASPEVFQYEHIINALSEMKDIIYFSVLGTSSYSSAGGVFDHIPIQDGLGFGLGPSLAIVESEGRILKIQQKASSETIKRQVNTLVKEYNSLIENYSIILERMKLANGNYSKMMGHISIGGILNVMEMIEILDNVYGVKLLLISYRYRFSDLVEKLKRVTFSGDYADGPDLSDHIINQDCEDDCDEE